MVTDIYTFVALLYKDMRVTPGYVIGVKLDTVRWGHRRMVTDTCTLEYTTLAIGTLIAVSFLSGASYQVVSDAIRVEWL